MEKDNPADFPNMIHGRIPPPRGNSTQRTPPKPFRDGLFSWRLILGLSLALMGCLLLFLVPALFFVEQNYDIFIRLAYDTKPALVQHLEREMIWLRMFLGMGALATIGVGFVFARRLVRHLLLPLEKMEDHLQSMTSGNWSTRAPELPETETYRTLFLTYDYFQRSLKATATAELRQLEKLNIDPAHREAFVAWKALLTSQRNRVGVSANEANGNAEGSSEVLPFRRVS